MKLDVTCKALEVIKDDHVIFAALRIEIGQHPAHAGAFEEITPARGVVRKDHLDVVAFAFGVLTAAVFLAVQA